YRPARVSDGARRQHRADLRLGLRRQRLSVGALPRALRRGLHYRWRRSALPAGRSSPSQSCEGDGGVTAGGAALLLSGLFSAVWSPAACSGLERVACNSPQTESPVDRLYPSTRVLLFRRILLNPSSYCPSGRSRLHSPSFEGGLP